MKKLTEKQQKLINEVALNNDSIIDYKIMLSSVLDTTMAGLGRIVNKLVAENLIEVVDEYEIKLTVLGQQYVTVEVTPETRKETEINKIKSEINFNVKAAALRLPDGYSLQIRDSRYIVIDSEGRHIKNETEVNEPSVIGFSESHVQAMLINAFTFLYYANENIDKLEKEYGVTYGVILETEKPKKAIGQDNKYARASEVIKIYVNANENTVYAIMRGLIDAGIVDNLAAAQELLSEMSCEDLIEITNIEKVGRATIVRIDLVNHDDVIDDNMVVDEAVGVPRLELLPEEIEDLKKFNAEYYELSHDDKLRLTIAYDMFNISELLPPGYRCTREENKIVIRNKFEEIVDHIEAGHYLMIDRDWVQAQYDKAFNIVDRVNEKCKYLGIFQEEVNE